MSFVTGVLTLPYLLQNVIKWILGRIMQYNSCVQVRTNAHVLDLAYAGDIVLFSNVHRGMQVLLETVDNRSDAVCMRINASNIKMLSTLISGELCQDILLDSELTCLSSLPRCSSKTARAPR